MAFGVIYNFLEEGAWITEPGLETLRVFRRYSEEAEKYDAKS
jgi:hypothetical protein